MKFADMWNQKTNEQTLLTSRNRPVGVLEGKNRHCRGGWEARSKEKK